MKRVSIGQRPDWIEKVEELNFNIHHMYGELYWDERNAYSFSLREIEDNIEDPTNELVERCYDAIDYLIENPEMMSKMAIPEEYHDEIIQSWKHGELDIYGRFDLSYGGNDHAKLLEFNADTPTSLYESSIVQWYWLQDLIQSGKLHPDTDQFNSIDERLVEAFKEIRIHQIGKYRSWFNDMIRTKNSFHFAACMESEEDAMTVTYMADCAIRAGFDVTVMDVEDIGITFGQDVFTDAEDIKIERLFKLYPLENMMREEFGPHLKTTKTSVYEPMWKALLSNKGILPVLWQLFPNHPNLLPAYFGDDPRAKTMTNYVKKPIFSREGENVTLVHQAVGQVESDGEYGEEGYVYQEAALLPKFGDDYAVIGSWVIAGKAAGIGIREDKGPITRNLSRYVPHFIEV